MCSSDLLLLFMEQVSCMDPYMNWYCFLIISIEDTELKYGYDKEHGHLLYTAGQVPCILSGVEALKLFLQLLCF